MPRTHLVDILGPTVTASNLTSGQVVYAGTGGVLSSSSGFAYNSGTATASVTNLSVTTLLTTPALTLTGFTAGNILFMGASGVVSQSGSLSYNSGTGTISISAVSASVSVSAPAVTVSGLTSGRVVLAGTGGLLGSDSGITFDGTSDTLTTLGPMMAGDNQLFTVALPTTVSNAVDVCTITNANFSTAAEVTLTVHLSGYAQTKHYYVPLAYDATASNWHLLTPLYTSGPYVGNDLELDIRVNALVATIRARRTGGTSSGNAQVSVRLLGDRAAYSGGATGTQLAVSSTTYTGQTVTTSYAATALSVTSTGAVTTNGAFSSGANATIGSVYTAGTEKSITIGANNTTNDRSALYLGSGVEYIRSTNGAAVDFTVYHGLRVSNATGLVVRFGDNSGTIDSTFSGAVAGPTFKASVVAKTANATLTLLEDTIYADPTTASFTLTLPAVAGTIGKRYLVKKHGTSKNTVTLDANASETIDGALTTVIRDLDEVCEIVSNGTEWKKITNYAGQVPVGGVVAWLKSFTNTPALPSGWVECNGQTLTDAGSVYGGGAQVIPNLNNSGGSATNRFLRGSTTSGTTAGSETHTHTVATTTASLCSGSITAVTGITGGITGATSTLPSYYEVVWVMRIK